MQKKLSLGDLFLIGAIIILSLIIIIDKTKDNLNEVKQVEEQLEENNSRIEELDKKEQKEEQTREGLDEEIKQLEELKDKPYGKENYTDNTSVIRAEQYFARRYRKD
jgi:TolA-binding protein